MLLCVPEVLTKAEVAEFRARLDAADWVDGTVTAGEQSAKVKVNEQIAEGTPIANEPGDGVRDAPARSPLFLSAALPLKTFPPLFNRYAGGQNFGTHVDNAIRRVGRTPHRIRTDLSATLF